MQIINHENVLESTKGALTKVHGRTTEKPLPADMPWGSLDKSLPKESTNQNKETGNGRCWEARTVEALFWHIYGLATPKRQSQSEDCEESVRTVKKYGCCWRTEYTGTREGIAEDRSGEWIYLVQTLIIADEAGEAEKDVNRWSRRSWKRRWMKPHIYIVST